MHNYEYYEVISKKLDSYTYTISIPRSLKNREASSKLTALKFCTNFKKINLVFKATVITTLGYFSEKSFRNGWTNWTTIIKKWIIIIKYYVSWFAMIWLGLFKIMFFFDFAKIMQKRLQLGSTENYSEKYWQLKLKNIIVFLEVSP